MWSKAGECVANVKQFFHEYECMRRWCMGGGALIDDDVIVGCICMHLTVDWLVHQVCGGRHVLIMRHGHGTLGDGR